MDGNQVSVGSRQRFGNEGSVKRMLRWKDPRRPCTQHGIKLKLMTRLKKELLEPGQVSAIPLSSLVPDEDVTVLFPHGGVGGRFQCMSEHESFSFLDT